MGLFDFLKKKEFTEIKLLREQLEKYAPISEIETETKHRRQELEDKIFEKNQEFQLLIDNKIEALKNVQDEFDKLSTNYKSSIELYTKLRKDISLYESKLDLIEFGIYEPVYDFEKSEDYRIEQNRINEMQKAMVQSETAAICRTKWTIDGSETKGRASTKKYIKLALRAFNGECSASISKVKWNNINQIKERIRKSHQTINKLGESQTVVISEKFLELKLKEVILEHEFQLKKQNEKEAMRAIQEELREEEKARREFEQVQRQAEKEEENFQRALTKARKEVENTTGKLQDELNTRILILEQELFLAQEKKERAISMAQQTKRGHVYIISNIGSFGENIYKIGMTRRLEPNDRVRELGDASVPFTFDVHAMIYSDEARTLEYELHKAFSDQKVNMLNYRKEFFNVSLEEIENKIAELGFEAEFTILPEAMQYRETLAILEKMNSKEIPKSIEDIILEEYPKSLI
ncbi:DUF4041 domain-containing protein [Algoriphagus aquimarinus]|uniref:DUF4041 domain-containing protein n=1 Tax=Algoriphagus aquimarinus TaxID=237018 RepID=UPI0030DC5B92|tara:strand:- start:227188 stop:228582 length:1395 start_codon:yes stop_codon:yes gene_type:complete